MFSWKGSVARRWLAEGDKARRRWGVVSLALYSNVSVPPVKTKWYYATDIPESKPDWYRYTKVKDPAKFIPFSDYDSSRLERRYQERVRGKDRGNLVEVNEDKLFQVDLEALQLSPVYWLGPTYEVRRGVWFYSNGMPLDTDIATVVEAGYRDRKQYLDSRRANSDKKNSQVSRETSAMSFKEITAKFNREIVDSARAKASEAQSEVDFHCEPDILELDNGKVVLYLDEKNAVMFPRTMSSHFQVNVLRNFGSKPSALLSVDRLQRGYSERFSESVLGSLPDNPIPGIADTFTSEFTRIFLSGDGKKPDAKESEGDLDRAAVGENRKPEELKSVLESDFDVDVSEEGSTREIDHLVLCIHGIGQILGHKYESVNFVHSINVLRNTMKEVYQSEGVYQGMAYPVEASEAKDGDSAGSDSGASGAASGAASDAASATSNVASATADSNSSSFTESFPDPSQKPFNNRIQVLPVSWRHRIDFQPRQQPESYDGDGDRRLPSLSQINVDGVKSLRNVLGDVVLDVLLYYEPRYVEQIFRVVTDELNRVYRTYRERNPNFRGKVHIMGHSLGSAIAFDILLAQGSKDESYKRQLDFDVANLFCVGSPLGMFKLLEHRNIAPRRQLASEFAPDVARDDFSSPKCDSLYNIFHPCDPVSYRMEPLIAPGLSKLKPAVVPFAVKGIHSQFNELVDLGDAISERLSRASSWFKRDKKPARDPSPEELAASEDALQDILSSLATPETKSTAKQPVELSPKERTLLNSANRSGRVDYCLPTGMFDFSLVSAISAHVSYFEDKDTAGFIMRELLRQN